MSGPLGIFGCRSQPVNLIVFSTFKVSLVLDSHTFLGAFHKLRLHFLAIFDHVPMQ